MNLFKKLQIKKKFLFTVFSLNYIYRENKVVFILNYKKKKKLKTLSLSVFCGKLLDKILKMIKNYKFVI